MDKEQSNRWKALQSGKRWNVVSMLYTFILWVVLIISFANALSDNKNVTSVIVATLVFCTLAIRSKMSDRS